MEIPIMAHFAELDSNNVVLRVVGISNEMLIDNGQESEAKGIAFCKQLFGEDSVWVQTSYNGNFRKHYAGIGYTYDQRLDAFIGVKPQSEGWTLDESACVWRNPTLEAELAAQQQIGVTRV
jgi:hypothetical protein